MCSLEQDGQIANPNRRQGLYKFMGYMLTVTAGIRSRIDLRVGGCDSMLFIVWPSFVLRVVNTEKAVGTRAEEILTGLKNSI
jgi:hypothetical protein